MNFHQIVAELTAERDQIDRAIAAIEGLNSSGRRRPGRPPRAAVISRRRGRMSAAGRARIAAAQRARWAKVKRAKASKPVRRMSRAARKKIAAAQRARWAKVKAQQ